MRILQTLTLALFFFISIGSFGQSIVQSAGTKFEVPQGYELKVKEDYAKYEKDIIEAVKWLKTTPLNAEPEKRREVSAFVVAWINGSPTVNVEITPSILDFENKNSGMLVIYMASSAQYVLENNYSKDMRAKHKAALHDMIAIYKAGVGIKKDKKMEKLIKAVDENKLDEWIANNMKVNMPN